MDSKRTLAVCAARLVALSLIVAIAACEEETTVEPPPPLPQVATTATYSKNSKGLPNSDVYAMLTLSNGEFWIGTEQGIARYPSVNATAHDGPSDIVNELNGLPNPKVRDMAELAGKVYVATWGGGFAVYDIAGDVWTSKTPINAGGDDVQTIDVGDAVTAGGVVVSAGPNAVLESSPRGDDRINGNRIIDGGNLIAQSKVWVFDGSIADIAVSPNEVYLATNDGISIYDPTVDHFTSFSALTRDVTSAVGVRDTPGGVERWYGPRVESVEDDPPPPMPAAGITVSRGSSTVFTYTTVNSGLPEPNVTAIYYDPDAGADVFWVATGNKGVSRVAVDTSLWTTYTMVQGLPSNTVYSVARAAAPGGGSTIWVATQNGVARLEGNGTWQGYNTGGGLTADRVRLVYSDDNARLWIGYVNGGAARLNPGSAQ